ncbi:MAG: caspase family protein [Gammaproteobacteria bacterium]
MISRLDYHALIIGVDDYDGGFKPLSGAVNDATAVADLLESEHNFTVERLLNAQASGAAIRHYLGKTLPAMLTEPSGFLLFFAGHGDARGDGTDGAQGYLLPQDASKADENTWLSMVDFRQLLDQLPCRHLLVILDCCFAGAFRWSATRGLSAVARPLYQSQFDRYLRETSWQALTSAAHDELAADAMPGLTDRRGADGKSGHSPFTSLLIEGLRGSADSSRGGNSPDGVITATELHQFVFEELASGAATRHQTPGIWPLRPDNKGEFIFANPKTEVNPKPDPPLTDESNPWLGLKTYSKGDADLFFGRQRVIRDLAEKLRDENGPSLLAVVGASGTGKSSVVKAGLLPLISNPKGGNWRVVESERLIGDPNQMLDASIAQLEQVVKGRPALLLIDQLEELYTQCPDEADRDRFLGRLRELIDKPDGPKVIVTIRSDFEPRPRGSVALKEIWPAAQFLVPAFDLDELRDIIEGPANVMAMFFEPDDLVSRLLNEVLAMPGALPLLSFALAEMYRHAQLRRRETGATDRALTEDDYERAGGVVGALHKRASLLYDEAGDEHLRKAIEKLFLRLVSQESGLTRRRVLLRELEFADEAEQRYIDEAIRRYVDGRLLMVDGDYIEPAHDTLVVAWDKLRGWLDRSGPQQLARSVWHAANEWHTNRDADGYLWHNDPRLQQAVGLHPQLNRLERLFIARSEARRKRNRRLMSSVAAVVVAAILGLSLWALAASQRALEQANRAKSEGIAMTAHASEDPILKALLLDALHEQQLPEPRAGMQIINEMNLQMAAQTVERVPYAGGAGWDFIDLSDPWIATASITSEYSLRYSYEGRMDVMSNIGQSIGDRAATVVTLGRPEIRNRDPNPPYAAGFDDGLIVVRNRGRELHTFDASAAISAMSFATEADYLLAATQDGSGRLISIQGADVEMQEIGEAGSAPLVAVAIDAQARLIAMADDAGAIHLLQRDGERVSPVDTIRHDAGITAVSLSADGTVLAAGTMDGTVAVWRRGEDGWQYQKTLAHDGEAISALAVSYRGAVVASLTRDHVWLWHDGGRAAPVRRQFSHNAKLHAVARLKFSDDQRLLHIVTENGEFLRTPVTFPPEGIWGNRVSAGAMRWNPDEADALYRSYRFLDSAGGWQAIVGEKEVVVRSSETGLLRTIPVPQLDMPPELAAQTRENEYLTPQVTVEFSRDGATAAIVHGSPVFWGVSIWDLEQDREMLAESGEGRLRNVWFADGGKGVVLSPTTGGANAERYLAPVAYVFDQAGKAEAAILEFANGYQPFALFNNQADTLALWGSHPYNPSQPSRLFVWYTHGRSVPQLLATRDGTIVSVEFDETGKALRVAWDDGHEMSYSLGWEAAIGAVGDSTITCLTAEERAQYLADDQRQRDAAQACVLK